MKAQLLVQLAVVRPRPAEHAQRDSGARRGTTSSGALEHALDRGEHAVEAGDLGAELPAARGGERVVARAAVRWATRPTSTSPTPFSAAARAPGRASPARPRARPRVNRSMCWAIGVAVHRLQRERLQNEHVERALEQLLAILGHRRSARYEEFLPIDRQKFYMSRARRVNRGVFRRGVCCGISERTMSMESLEQAAPTLRTQPVAPAAGVIEPEELRVAEMFADLRSDELAWIAAHCERIVLAPGAAAPRLRPARRLDVHRHSRNGGSPARAARGERAGLRLPRGRRRGGDPVLADEGVRRASDARRRTPSSRAFHARFSPSSCAACRRWRRDSWRSSPIACATRRAARPSSSASSR